MLIDPVSATHLSKAALPEPKVNFELFSSHNFDFIFKIIPFFFRVRHPQSCLNY